MFTLRPFKIATLPGKYMHILVNQQNKLATPPLDNTFIFTPEQFKIATPLANTCVVLLTNKTNLPPHSEQHVRSFFHQNNSNYHPRLANACIFLLTNKTNLTPLWTTGSFFHQNNSKLPPRRANTCKVLLTNVQHVLIYTRTNQNCHCPWQIHA